MLKTQTSNGTGLKLGKRKWLQKSTQTRTGVIVTNYSGSQKESDEGHQILSQWPEISIYLI